MYKQKNIIVLLYNFLIYHFLEIFDSVMHYLFSDTYQVLLSYSDTVLCILFVNFSLLFPYSCLSRAVAKQLGLIWLQTLFSQKVIEEVTVSLTKQWQ